MKDTGGGSKDMYMWFLIFVPISCIEPGLAIHFLYDIIHVSMPLGMVWGGSWGEGSGLGTHVYTRGRFMLMYGKTNTIL